MRLGLDRLGLSPGQPGGFPVLKGIGVLLHYIGAGALAFIMSLALTTFLGVGSVALDLFAVSGLAVVLLALFIQAGRGRGDAAQGIHLAVFAVIACAAVGGTHSIWHRRVETLKRELKAKGRPVTLADFQERHSDGQYANPALEAALTRLASPHGGYYYNLHPGEKVGVWSEATLKSESAAIAPDMPIMTKEVFPILENRRYLEEMDFLREAANPYATHTPKYALFILAAKVLNLDSVARARRGDIKGAWVDLRHAADLSDLAAPGPTLIGRMVAIADRRIIAQAAINIALNARAPLPKDLADRFQRSLADRLVIGGLGYEAARRFDLGGYFERCRWAECEPSEELTAVRLHPIMGRAMGLADIYALHEASRYQLDDSWPDWTRMRADMEKKSSPGYGSPLFEVRELKFVRNLVGKEWETRVWTQLALLSSAALRFHTKAGRYPRRLEELSPDFITPDLLIDPFSGNTFKFSVNSGIGDFELSSIGPDGTGIDSRKDEMVVRF